MGDSWKAHVLDVLFLPLEKWHHDPITRRGPSPLMSLNAGDSQHSSLEGNIGESLNKKNGKTKQPNQSLGRNFFRIPTIKYRVGGEMLDSESVTITNCKLPDPCGESPSLSKKRKNSIEIGTYLQFKGGV